MAGGGAVPPHCCPLGAGDNSFLPAGTRARVGGSRQVRGRAGKMGQNPGELGFTERVMGLRRSQPLLAFGMTTGGSGSPNLVLLAT